MENPEQFDEQIAHDEPFLIGDAPDTPVIPPTPSDNNPQFTRFGCISAVVLLALGTLICSSGNRWLFEPESFFGTSFGDSFWSTLSSGGTHAALLLVIGGAMWFLRGESLRLFRGFGSALLVSAIYSATNTLFIAWETPLPYPGLVDWLPPAVLFAAGLILFIGLRLYKAEAVLPASVLGVGLGLLATSPWAFAGALGEPAEILVAFLESLAFGLWFGVAASMIFFFDGEGVKRHPIWTSVMVGGFMAVMLPTFLAGRGGYVLTAVLLTPALTAMPLAAMFVVWPSRLNSHNRWVAPAAFLAAFLVVPLLFFEGIELEFMPEVSLKMAAGLFFVSIAAMFFAAVWLIVRVVAGNHIRPVLAVGTLLLALVILATGALLTDGGPWQQDTFFVVMVDQADTEFANGIEDRDERVSVVYEMLVDHATADQAEIRAVLDRSRASYTPFYLINALEVAGSGRLKRQLANREDVAYILDSPQARPTRDWFSTVTDVDMTTISPKEPAPGEPVWGIDEIGAPEVWLEFDVQGEGIIVGSADSGVEFTHPALIDSYVGSVDNHDYAWFDPGIGNSTPADSGGHGTHTTGTIVGQFGIGVAPAAQWIACRNLPRNLGNPADYVACMEFLFAPFPVGGDSFTQGEPTRGAHVTNNSWGCPAEEGCDGRTIGIGVAQLRNAGQMMVVSNGNSGPACETVSVPANNADAFSVGALNPSGESVAGFSSRGPALDYDGDLLIKPDIIAPGVEVISSLPGDTYGASQGTSMASPHVAGAVALLWSAAPDLIGDIDQTTEILTQTAQPLDVVSLCLNENGTDELNNISGHGVIDIYQATKFALER